MYCSPEGSTIHGILQARILEWLSFPSPADLPNPGIEPMSPSFPVLTGEFFTIEPPPVTREPGRAPPRHTESDTTEAT